MRSAVFPNPPAPAVAAAGSIGVSVNAGAIQTIPAVIDGTANNFSSPVNLTLTWDLHPSTGTVSVVAYFTNPAQAMVSGPVAIPASWIRGRVTTAEVFGAPTAFTPFTRGAVGGAGSAGGSLTLLTERVLGFSRTGTRTADFELQLDLTGRVLTPGTYTGTLHLRAVTQ